jgi:hypothetical protein
MPTKNKPTPLWVFNWDGGDGYNQVHAHTKREARKLAEAKWPGHKPVNMRALRSVGAQQLYWKNIPLMD